MHWHVTDSRMMNWPGDREIFDPERRFARKGHCFIIELTLLDHLLLNYVKLSKLTPHLLHR